LIQDPGVPGRYLLGMRNQGILATQWQHYGDVHRDRRNLAIHLATQPLFVGGLVALVGAMFTGASWLLAAGPAAMMVALALQGRGHRGETTPPAPFRGPLDAAARLFAEQLVTFPRFVLSGRFARAWRAGG
jgi:hypothetical protein